jgi:CRP/FNR family transcriptional regulator, cyclic AMP receptor protein
MSVDEMLNRFEGDAGRGPRVEAIAKQRIAYRNLALAEEIADLVELRAVPAGTVLIEQANTDNDLFLIFEGEFQILVDGAVVAKRGAGDHVGEIAAIQPALKRTATVVAKTDAVVGRLSEAAFNDVGDRYPIVYKAIAQQLAGRLLQQNKPAG